MLYKRRRSSSVKGMATQQLVIMALFLFAAAVLLIIFFQKYFIAEKTDDRCEMNNGLCVSPADCATCGTLKECKTKYIFTCKDDEVPKICCPKDDVINEGDET